jgi:flagellar basal-body rod protein FlgF
VDIGLYSGVSAMRACERRLDAITANLANLDTPAYKRASTSTQAFDLGLASSPEQRQVVTRERVDFTQGVLEQTGNPLDLALEGEGFFAVETPNGEAYTRNGSFHLDERGVLLSGDGDPVAWEAGRGTFAPVGDAVSVDGSGVVRQGSNELGRIKLVDFADVQRLGRDAQGRWIAPKGAESRPAAAIVHQGARERSNAQSIEELVAMIRVQRGFESAANLLRSIDQSYKRLNQQR